MKRRDLTVRAGDVLPASPWHVYGAPFGVPSLAVLGLWFFVLTIPIMGWFNKRELMLTQIARWDGTTWSAIVGVPVAVLALQVLLRLWLHYHSESRVGKISG